MLSIENQEQAEKDLEGAVDLLAVETPSRKDGGPRRPRIHKPRLIGPRAYVEVPAKTKRQRKNRAQRQARKANR